MFARCDFVPAFLARIVQREENAIAFRIGRRKSDRPVGSRALARQSKSRSWTTSRGNYLGVDRMYLAPPIRRGNGYLRYPSTLNCRYLSAEIPARAPSSSSEIETTVHSADGVAIDASLRIERGYLFPPFLPDVAELRRVAISRSGSTARSMSGSVSRHYAKTSGNRAESRGARDFASDGLLGRARRMV